MRILIIGEFSSFSKNLSAGFRAQGHDCFVFSWGDSFKKIEQGKNSYSIYKPVFNGKGIVAKVKILFDRLYSVLKLRTFVYKMSKYELWDVVLIINPGFINKKHSFFSDKFSKKMVLSLVRHEENVFLSACGGDVPYCDYWTHTKGKSTLFAIHYASDILSKKNIEHFESITTVVNKVIPVMFDYAEAWRKSLFSRQYVICPTIPLPVDIDSLVDRNVIKDKIVVFHGITRPKVKGTEYIKAALDKLQGKYPNKVECVVQGGMALKDYLEVLNRSNIVVDQTNAFSVGMNGLYAMALGKVVLGGNEPENQREFNNYSCPIINIGPNAEQIFEELEKLILNPQEIIRLSNKSLQYVKEVHDCKLVAHRYIEVFNQFGK